MTRVVFYLPNAGVSGVDFSKPWLGNPGVGGTQFLFMTQPFYLQRHAEKHGLAYEFILLTDDVGKLPAGTRAYSVGSDRDAVLKAQELGAQIFVFRPVEDDLKQARMELYGSSGMKLIGWAHNAYTLNLLDAWNDVDAYKAHVCVCHEQLDALLDKHIYDKATYIYNGFESEYASPLADSGKSNEVVYIGSLIPAKGFHMLAEAWPHVLARVPDAKLKVIGSGKVYDRGAELGSYGIAQDDYEGRFMRFLTDGDGLMLPSVEFMGLMGTDKFDVMKSATVGVVNPTGLTENCPGCALEFQACGVPVVSAARGGLWDTVEHGRTGLLVRNVEGLSEAIVQLLTQSDKRAFFASNCAQFVGDKFSYSSVCENWLCLLADVDGGARIGGQIPPKREAVFREMRLIKMGIRFANRWLPEPFMLPSIAGVRRMAANLVR